MNKFDKLILLHYKKYPALQLIDLFKLAYQNEYGPGHLITNASEYLNRLYEEKRIPHENRGVEDIGNNILRIDVECITDVQLFTSYAVESASDMQGSNISFVKKMERIVNLIKKKNLPISLKDDKTLKERIINDAFTPFSHSDSFNESYSPHYRIIKKKDWKQYQKQLAKKH